MSLLKGRWKPSLRRSRKGFKLGWVREHDECLMHVQWQRGVEDESFQQKYAQAHEEQLRVYKQASEDRMKT